MNIELLVVGKTDSSTIEELVRLYQKRLSHYANFSITTLPDIKRGGKLSAKQHRDAEADSLLSQMQPSDFVVLLDERGTQYSSMEFSQWLEKRMVSGVKRLLFVVGGPFGFAESVYQRANSKISLSRMTFTHQFIRVIFTEQLYRAFTILNNEPYHNE
ncbi:MAG: 23S rRNA (pseudouridine(1915)-N(3))-methyltransferase RlmH [Rikenellaceae bacterium]